MNPEPNSGQNAVVLHPGLRNIGLETVTLPAIEKPDDAIVKILLSGLCGSDLHAFRGLELFDEAYVMGHEFIGEVTALGSSFPSINDDPKALTLTDSSLRIGTKVICPFSVSCGDCDFCHAGFTSRCVHSRLLGSPTLPGAQAQFIRIPKARGSLRTVEDLDVPMETAILLGDILPTGYWAVKQALRHPNISQWSQATCLTIAIVGLGPVGQARDNGNSDDGSADSYQCALISLLDAIIHMDGLVSSELGFTSYKVWAIDRNQDRLDKTAALVQTLVQAASKSSKIAFLTPEEVVKKSSDPNAAAHAVCEIVGHDSAIRLAYDIIRPFGVIFSVGVHTSPTIPISGGELYTKNISLSFGRCPVRAIMNEVAVVLKRQKDVLAGLVDKTVGFSAGSDGIAQAYKDFDEGRVGKVLFDPWN